MKTTPSTSDLLLRCQCLPGFTFTLSGQITTRPTLSGTSYVLPIRAWNGANLIASEMAWTRTMPATVDEMEQVLADSFDFEELLERAELEREMASYVPTRYVMSEEESEARWLNGNGNFLS